MIKEELVQEQENALKEDCYEQAQNRMKELILRYFYDSQALLDAAQETTLSGLMAYKTRFFEHIYLEAFVAGQVDKEVSLGLATRLEDLLQLS